MAYSKGRNPPKLSSKYKNPTLLLNFGKIIQDAVVCFDHGDSCHHYYGENGKIDINFEGCNVAL
ncbi:MAG: hypothetical protein IPI53_09380 [Saprospiraceae bacterium]|nr:hypothetical protein [Saprospiraceae bacterium]